jgi:putative ABC transport system permease protein
MLKYFFKITVRHLWRKRTYSMLNFICLTFGLTCAIITALYILNAFSFDKFHRNYSRLYAVDAYVTYFNGARFPKEYLSASLTDVLKVQAPEIEEMTRIAEVSYTGLYGDNSFIEKGLFADSNFFRVFTFPMVNIDIKNVLSDPNSIVISERMAMKYFRSTDCAGKTLILKKGERNDPYKVAGVFRDVPDQSILHFDFVIPFSKFLADNKWAIETGATANETWILLKDNVDFRLVENKIRNLIKNQETTLNQELFLFPLREHILYSYSNGKRVWKEMQNIVIIGTIGFFILLIACFNFINLAIAMNFRRYREAGIKKVAGAGKSAILFHFLGETFIITLTSLLTAITLTKILVIAFDEMFNYSIHFKMLDLKMIIFFSFITIFTGLISGLLPALYLASSNPVDTLKGKIITSHSYSIFRQSLIIFQFTIPIVLIICVMIIRTQDNYMRNYDVGVDKDKLIILDNTPDIKRHAESVRAELLSVPGIAAVSFTNCIPTRGTRVSSEVSWEGKDVTEKLHFWCINSDFEYNKAVKVNITAGRFFNGSFSTDSDSYLINDVAANVMKNINPIGTKISVDGHKGTIIGIFKDFHAIDLAGPIVPALISIRSDERPFILVKYFSGSFTEIKARINEVYRHYETKSSFKATLFCDLVPYSNLSQPSSLVGLAFIIAILLACMGLFGLASFTSENRTKEIGIRKTNGATTASIMGLLLSNYTRWLMLASFIAIPIAFMLGEKFLGRFQFHTPIPIWAFFAGPFISFVIALMTVSVQTWYVARRNPVISLRHD